MRQHYVVKAMVGGLLGTLLQTIMVYGVAPMLAGQSMDMAAMLPVLLCSGHARAPPQRDLPAGVYCYRPNPYLDHQCQQYALGRASAVRRRGYHGADAGRRGL